MNTPATSVPKLDPSPDLPLYREPTFLRWCFLGTLVLFSALALEYLRTDFWMDEIITIYDYGAQSHWQNILQKYPIANNHILFSVVLWHWMQLNLPATEDAMRFPCLLFAFLSVLVLYWQGRRLFPESARLLVTMLFALSPVYLAFFYQLRGYGLSILLAMIATLGVLRIVRGDRVQGLCLFVPAAILLPMAIPSNLLLNGSLVGYLALTLWWQGRRFRRGDMAIVAVCAVCGVAGMLLYVPIWEDFMEVTRNTGGWESGWQVAGNVALGFGAHVGAFLLAVLALRRQPEFGEVKWKEEGDVVLRSLPILLFSCAVPILIFALVLAPWPRAMLAYFAPFTVCGLIGFRERLVHKNIYFLLLILMVLANLLVFHKLSDYTSRSRLEDGEYPQNLLQQFYARNDDISQTALFMVDNPLLPPNSRIFIDVHFFHSMEFYWQRHEVYRSQLQLECLDGGTKFALKEDPAVYPFYPQFILAYNIEEARQSYRKTVGFDVMLEPLQSPTRLVIFYVTAMAVPRERRQAFPPPFVPPPFDAPPPSPPPEEAPTPPGVPISFPSESRP